MNSISPIVRLTLGLLLLTISMLLVSDLIGLVPDKQKTLFQARKAIAETLAMQISADISDDQYREAEHSARLMQQRNDDLLSVGLRDASQQIIFSVGDHESGWQLPAQGRSTYSHFVLPLQSAGASWGSLEIRFKEENSLLGAVLHGQSILGVVLFISIFGSLVYWLFLKRALRELDPASVVPERVKNALDSLSDGLVILDRAGHILFANSTFSNKTGLSDRVLLGLPLSSLDWKAPAEMDDKSFVFPWNVLLKEEVNTGVTSFFLVSKSGKKLSVSVNVTRIDDPNGNLQGAIVTLADLTSLEKSHRDLTRVLHKLELSQHEIAKQNKELQKLASYDPLTGILNRRALFEGFNELIEDAQESDNCISCLMVDIDHFKLINDGYGHSTGDIAIKLMAETLTDMVRPEDIVGRYGGEEFVIVLKNMPKEEALELAQRIRLKVEGIRIPVGIETLSFTSSFGVATYHSGYVTADDMVDKADKALYVAKETGRNKVVHFQDRNNQQQTSNGPSEKLNNNAAQELNEESIDSPSQEEVLLARIELLETQVKEQKALKPSASSENNIGRVLLIERIQKNINRLEQNNGQAALLIVGSNTIAQVRGALGHSAAEKLAKLVLERLRLSIMPLGINDQREQNDSSFSKLGTEEFALLLKDVTGEEDAINIVQEITLAFKEPLIVEGNEVLVVPSIGVSYYPHDTQEPEMLLTNASAALLEASTIGYANCVFFSAQAHRNTHDQLRLSAQLQKAIKHDGLFLEYLPKIDINSGQVTGFEALLRWYHPESGMVEPTLFIALAERTGMLSEIGRWVTKTAANQLRQWQLVNGFERLTMTVNFSMAQFKDARLADDILSLVNEAGVASSDFIIDVNQAYLMENDIDVKDSLSVLYDAGLGIALDDFGTGSASLSALRDSAYGWIKIDRCLIKGFESNPQDTEIVTSMIAMAHSLGLKVVAEGVEELKQLIALKKINCDEVQGQFFSKPLLKDQVTRYLQEHDNIKNILKSDTDSSISMECDGLKGILNSVDSSGYDKVT